MREVIQLRTDREKACRLSKAVESAAATCEMECM